MLILSFVLQDFFAGSLNGGCLFFELEGIPPDLARWIRHAPHRSLLCVAWGQTAGQAP